MIPKTCLEMNRSPIVQCAAAEEDRSAPEAPGAERETGMPACRVGLDTVDWAVPDLLELFPACETRTPMLVTKTAVAAKSPICAAHRCEIITPPQLHLFDVRGARRSASYAGCIALALC
jgi:hypothetical protein